MKIRALLFTAMLLCVGASSAMAQGYKLQSYVIASGATPMSNGTYILNGTIGQAVIGPVSNSVFTDQQGFWYTTGSLTQGAVKPLGEAAGYDLGQNYPNPFNPSTTIRFSIPERVTVTLRVMNLLGEEVARVIDDETYNAGSYQVDFAPKDIPSGTYIYRLEAGNVVKTKKMVLMK